MLVETAAPFPLPTQQPTAVGAVRLPRRLAHPISPPPPSRERSAPEGVPLPPSAVQGNDQNMMAGCLNLGGVRGADVRQDRKPMDFACQGRERGCAIQENSSVSLECITPALFTSSPRRL